MSTDEIVAGVMGLFPSADRQALQCLADLMAKRASEECSALRTESDRLRSALRILLDHYVSLAESGDAGFWDCEQEVEVKTARAALAG